MEAITGGGFGENFTTCGLLSLGLFVFHQRFFIYAANALTDLSLAVLAWFLYSSLKKAGAVLS